MFNFSLAPLKKPARIIRRQLPPINFITIHWLYFTSTCLLSAIILWGSATPHRSLEFTDALFLAVSAMTLAGLNTVNLSTLNTFQQFWLFLLIMLGSAIFVSAFVVWVRRASFEKKFDDIYERRKQKRGRSWSRPGRSWTLSRRNTDVQDSSKPEDTNEEKGNSQDTTEEGDAIQTAKERSVTPPARRGGPEMNGISSETGEKLDRADTLDEYADGPRNREPALQFRSDTVFNRRAATQSPVSTRRRPQILFNAQGVGARPSASLSLAAVGRFPTVASADPSIRPKSRGGT